MLRSQNFGKFVTFSRIPSRSRFKSFILLILNMAAVLKLLEYRTSSQLTYVTPSNKANKVNSGKVIDLVV